MLEKRWTLLWTFYGLLWALVGFFAGSCGPVRSSVGSYGIFVGFVLRAFVGFCGLLWAFCELSWPFADCFVDFCGLLWIFCGLLLLFMFFCGFL